MQGSGHSCGCAYTFSSICHQHDILPLPLRAAPLVLLQAWRSMEACMEGGKPGHRRQAERDFGKALARVEAHLARDGGQVDVARRAAPHQLRKQRLPDALLPVPAMAASEWLGRHARLFMSWTGAVLAKVSLLQSRACIQILLQLLTALQ